MTQKDKELLFRDLCARIPYNVKCYNSKYRSDLAEEIICITVNYNHPCVQLGTYLYKLEQVKPYLFPLSSMTEEQEKEIQQIIGNPDYACIIRKTDGLELWLNFIDTDPTIWLDAIFEVQDYLNKNHFDYRGLIEKGLAIDVTGLNIY